jgi:hypothetical protein
MPSLVTCNVNDSVKDFIGSTAKYSDGVTLGSPGMGETSVEERRVGPSALAKMKRALNWLLPMMQLGQP